MSNDFFKYYVFKVLSRHFKLFNGSIGIKDELYFPKESFFRIKAIFNKRVVNQRFIIFL